MCELNGINILEHILYSRFPGYKFTGICVTFSIIKILISLHLFKCHSAFSENYWHFPIKLSIGVIQFK